MNIEQEEWRIIEQFPRYAVSSFGRVKSSIGKEEIILKPNVIQGYEYVKLYRKDGNNMSDLKLARIHRLVAQAFCDNFNTDKEVHHKDLNTRNNKKENLICLTQEEHIKLHKELKKNKGVK